MPSDFDRQKAIDDALNNTENSLSPVPSSNESYADTLNQAGPKDSLPVHKRYFDLAFQTESYNYRTGDKWPPDYSFLYTTSDSIKKNASLIGLYGSATYKGTLHTWDDTWSKEELPNYAKIEFEGSEGKSNYSSYVTGKIKGDNSWNIDGRLLFGYAHVWNNITDFTPFLGIGYQRFSDKDGGWVDFVVDSYEKYTNITSMFYIPIGVETHTTLNDQWDINFKLEGDVVCYGTTVYSLNDIPGDFPGIDLQTGLPIESALRKATSDLNGGFGFRTSLKLIKKYKNFDLYFEPFFKFLYLNKSQEAQMLSVATNGKTYISDNWDGTPNKPLWDAKNTTIDAGARAGVEF